MARYCVLVICCCGVLLTITTALPKISEKPLKIAAFNIQIFGEKKMNKEAVEKILIKILMRYDLILVQEIRDRDGKAFGNLRDEINKLSPLAPFDYVVSRRLGRSNSKEQYGFLYRTNRVKVTGVYQFKDVADVFEREPFAVRLHSDVTELSDFAIIATHIAPKAAVTEIDQLTNVYDKVVDHWKLQSVLLAGDFNADCSYLRQSKWSNVSLRTEERFHWLIGDSEDTTTSHSDCSYDRFVTASFELINTLVPGSVKVYQFDKDLGLEYEEALAVSDHYPIELELKGKVNKDFQSEFQSGLSFVVSSNQPVMRVDNIRAIYRKGKHWMFQTEVFYGKSGAMKKVMATIPRVRDVVGELLKFTQTFPNVLSDNVLAMVKAYFEIPIFHKDVFINGLDLRTKDIYKIEVTCRLKKPYNCEVRVTKYLT